MDLPGRRSRSAVPAFAKRADHDARYFDFNFIYASVTNDDGVVTGIFRDGFYVAVLSPKLQITSVCFLTIPPE
jgi:hypothetical protein